MFVATVVPLHWLQPGYDARHQLMSELALGRYGETMLVAFAGLALAMLGAFLSRAAGPPAVRWLLAAAALFFLLAGVFPLGHSILPMGIGQRLAAACLLLWLVLLGWSLRARR